MGLLGLPAPVTATHVKLFGFTEKLGRDAPTCNGLWRKIHGDQIYIHENGRWTMSKDIFHTKNIYGGSIIETCWLIHDTKKIYFEDDGSSRIKYNTEEAAQAETLLSRSGTLWRRFNPEWCRVYAHSVDPASSTLPAADPRDLSRLRRTCHIRSLRRNCHIRSLPANAHEPPAVKTENS